MSGFEIAGLVLGAIPIALELLKKYEDAANRLKYWRKIQVEYLKCKGELEMQALLFKMNLRRLLLPLDLSDIDIEALLENPGSPTWKDPSVDHLLQVRLQDTYSHYLRYVQSLHQTMESLKDVLAIDSTEVQTNLGKSGAPWRVRMVNSKLFDSKWWGYEKYRLQFAFGSEYRRQLLQELQEYNGKLKELLGAIDEDVRLVMDRENSIIDDKLCSFWVQATRIYNALSSHWGCECGPQAKHAVHVSLEHSVQNKPQFRLAWSKTQQQLCNTCYLQITKAESLSNAFEKMSVHQPSLQARNQPTKSAMKGKGSVSGQQPRRTIPSVKILTAPTPAVESPKMEKISSICASLNPTETTGCVGYVLEEDSIYYVSQEPKPSTSKPGDLPVALEDLVRSRVREPPSRRERCRIALDVASSFMQLLDTPWMPPKAQRPEIVLVPDEQYYSPELVLQYSLLREKRLAGAAAGPANLVSSPGAELFGPMEFLGVLLLEFCFWSLLEEHPQRALFSTPNTPREKLAFDMAAANLWKREVLEDSGLDYDNAVEWCFKGHKDTSSTSWRKDMFRNVIQPLDRCYKYLSGSAL